MAHPLIPKFLANKGKPVKVVLRGTDEPIADCTVKSVNSENGLVELEDDEDIVSFLVTDVLGIITKK